MKQTRETRNDSPPTKIPQKTTKKAIAKKEILRILSDGKFYSTRRLAAKIPPLTANQKMILRCLKELEMTKEVCRTSFLWSIN
jgi:DNA-binding HxlR family transcriptional regulator